VTISAFGLTDVGRKRRHNEDAYLLDVERGLFVVADGMGGHAAGEVASRITVESIQEFIAGTEEEHENTWPFGFNNRYSLEGNRLTTAVEKANEKVMRAVQNRPELKGMGTTVVAALFDQDRVTLVHVGDSRAYLYRGQELKRLTDDHSWVQEQVNAGILSEDEAKSHPLKNVVTRALGGAAHVAVDLIEVPLTAGDRFLLCSDGLTGMVSDEELIEHLGGPEPPDRTVRSLIELANEHGGIDNVTAILVEVTKNSAGRVSAVDPTAILGTTISTESTVTVTPITQDKTEKVSKEDVAMAQQETEEVTPLALLGHTGKAAPPMDEPAEPAPAWTPAEVASSSATPAAAPVEPPAAPKEGAETKEAKAEKPDGQADAGATAAADAETPAKPAKPGEPAIPPKGEQAENPGQGARHD
jgi:protein phosphatase